MTADPPDLATADERLDVESPVPLTLAVTLRGLPTTMSDPTCVVRGHSALKALHTPSGPSTVLIRQRGRHSATIAAWGPGAEAAARTAVGWLGIDDTFESFDPSPHPAVAAAARRRPLGRLGRFGGVVERLVPTIFGQKVIAKEAKRSYRRLVWRFGEPAPGWSEVRLPPSPDTLRSIGTHEFHRLGVERARADIVIRVAAQASRLDRLVDVEVDAAYRALRHVRGIGPWTVGTIGIEALGDPDAVPIGDYNVPSLVTHALAGERTGTDERMLELLEPFRGHRGRVVQILKRSGAGPSRRGPRLAFRSVEDH